MTALLPSLLSGIALGLSAGLSPGPLTTLLMGETLRHGRGAGLRIAFVPLLSDLPIVLLSVFILSQLSDFDPVLGGISLAGGLFVAFLAYESFAIGPLQVDLTSPPPSTLRKGVITNFFNPHPYLFWIAVGAPLMLRPDSGLAAVLFVTAFYIFLVGSKVAMALLIARFRDLLVSRFYLLINRLLGLVLLFFSFVLLKDCLQYFHLLD